MKRIFVGSSTEGIEKAKHVCEVLKTPGEIECDLWTSFFEVGLLTFEALESMLLTCCAAVFVATQDDVSQIRGKKVKTPRANVMLEFGLVAERLGRTSIALCQYGGAELPSDLAGLTKIDMDLCKEGATQSELGDFRRCAEEKLRKWSSSLLATIDAVPRTEIVLYPFVEEASVSESSPYLAVRRKDQVESTVDLGKTWAREDEVPPFLKMQVEFPPSGVAVDALTGWVEWFWSTLRQQPSLIRFWVGIGSSSRTI